MAKDEIKGDDGGKCVVLLWRNLLTLQQKEMDPKQEFVINEIVVGQEWKIFAGDPKRSYIRNGIRITPLSVALIISTEGSICEAGSLIPTRS